MNKLLFSVALMAVVGCAVSDANELYRKPDVLFKSTSNLEFGVWVGFGPRIVSAADGKPLPNAKVYFIDRFSGARRYLKVDGDGRIVFNRFISMGNNGGHRAVDLDTIHVECPGYHSDEDYLFTYNDDPDWRDIRLKPVLDQPCCNYFRSLVPFCNVDENTICSFDVVDGDWLPPYGWGRVEDLRCTFSTNFVSSDGYSSPRIKMKFEFVREDDGFAVDKGDDYSKRSFVIRAGTGYGPQLLKVRNHFGRIDWVIYTDGPSVRPSCFGYADGPHGCGVGTNRMGKLALNLRVNSVPGIREMEMFARDVSVTRPVSHPVPEGPGRLAFGVSSDGRSAVCFGWTQDGAVVPEIFTHALYSENPAADLPRLETMYYCAARYRRDLEVCGFPELRVFVRCHDDPYKEILKDNPKLEAVVFAENGAERIHVRESDCCVSPRKVAALHLDSSFDFPIQWKTNKVSEAFASSYDVPLCELWAGSPFFLPELDFDAGTVDLPVLRFNGDYLEERHSDGRVLRCYKDGRQEKLRESR